METSEQEQSAQEQQRRAAKAADSDHQGFGVAASPLNIVKFELGVIICVAAALWLALDSITANLKGQLLILALYGIAAMYWVIYRTKRVVKSCSIPAEHSDPSRNRPS